jgi:hypothetical protein
MVKSMLIVFPVGKSARKSALPLEEVISMVPANLGASV